MTIAKVHHLEHPSSLMLTTEERHQTELGKDCIQLKDSIQLCITVLSETEIRIKSESCFLDYSHGVPGILFCVQKLVLTYMVDHTVNVRPTT